MLRSLAKRENTKCQDSSKITENYVSAKRRERELINEYTRLKERLRQIENELKKHDFGEYIN